MGFAPVYSVGRIERVFRLESVNSRFPPANQTAVAIFYETGLTKSEVRSKKSEVRSYFCNGDLSKAPKIFRLKRRGCATQLF
ncbi:MAG: hypothetical protein F6K39_03335 [Okeania sp. SIO3B3]|nr:hypothetical protein [Okeania sp. SIO3B3]